MSDDPEAEARVAAHDPAAMTAGSITLADVAAKTPTLGVTCNRCPRSGRYRLDMSMAA